jgi:hypothetical protein
MVIFELLQAQRAGEDEAKEEQQGRKAKRNSARKAAIKNPDTSPSQIINASNVGNDSSSTAATS